MLGDECCERIAGADLNARTEWGDTAIHYTALIGHPAMF
jgi:hypothetical protein